MDIEEYKNNCELYYTGFIIDVGISFVIKNKFSSYEDSYASIVLSKDRKVRLENVLIEDSILCTKIKHGKTKEELEEFLLQILKYEIFNLREKEQFHNFLEEAHHFYRSPMVNRINYHIAKELFDTTVLPFKLKDDCKIKFLLSFKNSSDFQYLKLIFSLYKFIDDETFVILDDF